MIRSAACAGAIIVYITSFPLFVWLITLELVAILITSLSVAPIFIRNLLLCVHCTVSYNSLVAHFTPCFHP